jgi:high-affinity iron transporter
VTVTLIMILSVAFVGGAIHSLQEAGFIGATTLLHLLPRLPHALATLTGFHPTLETIAAQLLLTGVYVASLVALQVRQRKVQPAMAKHRGQVASA